MNQQQQRQRVSAKTYVENNRPGADFSAITVPEGVQLFKPQQPGVYRLAIIEYPASATNPAVDQEGWWYFERTYYTHRDVGPNKVSVICPARTAEKPCPICEYRQRLEANPDSNPDIIKDFRPKKRQLFNVFDFAEQTKGVQVWDVSEFLFGRALRAALDMGDEADDFYSFTDPNGGHNLVINLEQESFDRNKFLKCTAVQFRKREAPLPEQLANAYHKLDDMVAPMQYDQLRALFLQVPDDDVNPNPVLQAPEQPQPQQDWGNHGQVQPITQTQGAPGGFEFTPQPAQQQPPQPAQQPSQPETQFVQQPVPPQQVQQPEAVRNAPKPDSVLEDPNRQAGQPVPQGGEDWGSGAFDDRQAAAPPPAAVGPIPQVQPQPAPQSPPTAQPSQQPAAAPPQTQPQQPATTEQVAGDDWGTGW